MHPWSHETFSLVCFIWFLHVILLDFCIILCHDHNISNVFPNVLSFLIPFIFSLLIYCIYFIQCSSSSAHVSGNSSRFFSSFMHAMVSFQFLTSGLWKWIIFFSFFYDMWTSTKFLLLKLIVKFWSIGYVFPNEYQIETSRMKYQFSSISALEDTEFFFWFVNLIGTTCKYIWQGFSRNRLCTRKLTLFHFVCATWIWSWLVKN